MAVVCANVVNLVQHLKDPAGTLNSAVVWTVRKLRIQTSPSQISHSSLPRISFMPLHDRQLVSSAAESSPALHHVGHHARHVRCGSLVNCQDGSSIFLMKGQRHGNGYWVRLFYWCFFPTCRHTEFAVIDFWPLIFGEHGMYEALKAVPTIAFKST